MGDFDEMAKYTDEMSKPRGGKAKGIWKIREAYYDYKDQDGIQILKIAPFDAANGDSPYKEAK